MRAGLCSVALRAAATDEVIDLAVRARLAGIEWGGDVHVPPGDPAAAAAVGRATRAAGLAVSGYGSYLFAGETAPEGCAAVLDTAVALGAPAVRVWCPFGVEPGAGRDEVARVEAALGELCATAAGLGLDVVVECHGGTLTASAAGALDLLVAVDAPNLRLSWQAPYWDAALDPEAELAALAATGRLGTVHVYEWDHDLTRHALARGVAHWPPRLAIAAAGGAGWALLEFVPGDDPDAVLAEGASLRAWMPGDQRDRATSSNSS